MSEKEQNTNCPICGAQNSIYVRVKAVIDLKLKANGEFNIPEEINVNQDIALEDQAISCFCGECGRDSRDDYNEMKLLLLKINNS